MSRSRAHARAAALMSVFRFARSHAAALCALWVLTPALLAAGALGGVHALAHAHDGHGLHFHGAESIRGAEAGAAAHLTAHAAGRCSLAGGESCSDAVEDGAPGRSPNESPEPSPTDRREGVKFSVPDLDSFRVRAAGLDPFRVSHIALPPMFIVTVSAWADRPRGDSGGGGEAGSLPACARRAGERIVRTSRALLI
ncbi:MAG: hypothetical protein ACKVU4_06155 [Phycisphaerales bacterium]